MMAQTVSARPPIWENATVEKIPIAPITINAPAYQSKCAASNFTTVAAAFAGAAGWRLLKNVVSRCRSAALITPALAASRRSSSDHCIAVVSFSWWRAINVIIPLKPSPTGSKERPKSTSIPIAVGRARFDAERFSAERPCPLLGVKRTSRGLPQCPLLTQSGHPLSLERYDHDQTSSQKFDCRLDPGWCHPRCHCSGTDAADADHQDSGRRHLRPWRGHVAGSAHFADRGSRDRAALSRWQDRPVVFVGRPAGCRLHPQYDRHSGSARHAGGAATRQSPSDDVSAHADRSA